MRPNSDDTSPAAARKPRTGAESARYGVLRRLGPVLKHDMVVNLQAISMMAEVLNARLERGTPTPADFQNHIAKLNRLARDAVASCLKVSTWIEPGEDQGVQLDQGVQECMALLASNFNFRGFQVSHQLTDSDFQVWRIPLRNLLVACLISLTDASSGPCVVLVSAEIKDNMAEITINVQPREDAVDALSFEPSYRHLDWADVQALAAAESVELERGPDEISIRMPRAVATAPLQIAPV